MRKYFGNTKNNAVFKFFTILFFKNPSIRATGQKLSSPAKTSKEFSTLFRNSEVVKEIALFLLDKSMSWTKKLTKNGVKVLLMKSMQFLLSPIHTCQ